MGKIIMGTCQECGEPTSSDEPCCDAPILYEGGVWFPKYEGEEDAD